VQIVPVDLPFDPEVRYIESRPQRTAPIPVDPPAIDTNSEGWSKQTEKRPIEPVIDNIPTWAWVFGVGEIWHYRFVSDGRIIKRKGAGKESVACNAMRVRRMNTSQHR
jgi:hypothetical protein